MLEDIVIKFISQVILQALQISSSVKVTDEDILYLEKRDARKFRRIQELRCMNDELKKARKVFDEVKYV